MNVSHITERLAIGAWPHSRDSEALAQMRFDLIISMTLTPLSREVTRAHRVLRLPAIDSPLTPIPMRHFRAGVAAALPVLAEGGRILVHCRAGRHRSVAMAACILIATGMPADAAMALIIAKRPYADPHIFYIEKRIYAFEAEWLAEHPAGRPNGHSAEQPTPRQQVAP